MVTDQALRAEIEAALAAIPHPGTDAPMLSHGDAAYIGAALLPLVEARERAAAQAALAEVRAGIEATPGPVRKWCLQADSEATEKQRQGNPSNWLAWDDVLRVLDAAEASQ